MPKLALRQKGLQSPPKAHLLKKRPLIWFHCASLGEFEQGRPLIERFREEHPDWQILLTFFSASGYEVRKNYKGADFITYLPLDLPSDVIIFLDFWQPKIAVFVKYEFWRNFIGESKKRGIHLISISTILRPNQYFFKFWGASGRETLRAFDHFFVQNAETKSLLESIQITATTIAGDTRFDRVLENKQTVKKLPLIEHYIGDADVFLAGSVWAADMEMLVPFIEKANYKFIIAPHEIHEEELEKWSGMMNQSVVLYSQLAGDVSYENVKVLIIDNIGMLSALYQYGTVAYIGGAFGKGLHNILEAVVFGLPVFFGNKSYQKFQEAIDLRDLGSAFPIENVQELTELNELIRTKLDKIKKINEAYIQRSTGATSLIMKHINEFFVA